jgi:hypothetical protein
MAHEPLAETDVVVQPYVFRDVDVYPEDLPPIVPQELRIIGRCVSFLGLTVTSGTSKAFKYKGMVSHISKETVSLLDCVRFEVASFEEEGRTLESELEQYPQVLPSAVRVEPIPAEGNFGRIPYLTFLRRKISQVKFETDTPLTGAGNDRSTFMGVTSAGATTTEEGATRPSLPQPSPSPLESFRDGQWLPHDEQKLRMLVRRYIVHSTQGNNPQKLSLRQFLVARLDGRVPPAEVLLPIATEEVNHMAAVSTAIGGQAGTQNQNRNAPPRRQNQAQQQRPLLVGTIASRTSYVAVLHIALAIAILLYSASVITMADGLLVEDFVRPFITNVAVAAALLLFCGCVTGLHALRLQNASCRIIAGRLAFMLAAAALVAYALNTVARGIYSDQQPDSTSMRQYYLNKAKRSPNDVCAYFIRESCSGFDRICNGPFTNPDQCPSCTSNGGVPCRNSLQDAVSNGLLPLFCLLIAAAVSVLLDILMFALYAFE